MFASAVCVSATPTTLAVLVTALWIRPHAWPSTGKSAMAAASVSVVPASVQTQSFRGQPVRCVRPALASVQSIKNVFSAEPSIKEKRKTHVHRNAHISTLQRLKIGTNYPSQARLILCPIVRRRMLMIAGFISHIP